MHFAFVTLPAHGHVNPTLPLVRELVRRGHRVSYAVHEPFHRTIESAGAAPIALPGEMPVPPPGGMPSRPSDFNLAGMSRMLDYFLTATRDGVAALEEHFAADRPDAVCYDAMDTVGRATAERLGLPDVALHSTHASHEDLSLLELLRSESGETSGVLPIFSMMRQVSEQLAADLGIKPTAPLNGTPAPLNIVFIPREFQIAGDTFDERFHFVGPSIGARATDENWQAPQPGRPLLFISLGTAFNNQPDFFRECLKAFGDGQWRVAMAVGGHLDASELGRVPENFDIRPRFPQLAVLSHADVFLTHAGMNSTMESLYFGVPMVAVPQMAEQDANARQAERLGFALRLGKADITADLLRRSVDQIHADQQVRGSVTEMGRKLRATDGAAAAADALEAHLAD
ncbi:macrolide family glycosyltransferase [Marinactinospora rubrisoli]|uniref:Macrolide family glycosyltransferase n=1 Tax=Marinactinospora rubrisoli TaxID=2715399 RepID=A0ABW2KIU1_9ACTN